MPTRATATNMIAGVTVTVSVLAILWNVRLAALYWGFTPALVGVDISLPLAAPWGLRPFTSALIHAGWLHLIANMVMLLIVGTQVEKVIGRSGLIIAYVVGAFAASVAQYLAGPNSVVPMVGASGAISALFGLYGLFFGKPPQVSGNQKVNRAIHVAWLFVAWVVINWMTAKIAGTGGILLATPAHIGGFLAGLLMQRPLLLWRYRKA